MLCDRKFLENALIAEKSASVQYVSKTSTTWSQNLKKQILGYLKPSHFRVFWPFKILNKTKLS